MSAQDEPVAVYDGEGNVTGVAPRGVVYRERLWHAATGVLVRSVDGRGIVLHRRTDTKLIFPGAWDCWAGGVVGPGEDPLDAAARELEEELGIAGVPLEPLPRFRYEGAAGSLAGPRIDEVRYHVFCYEARWDGPLRPQPEEVAWAGRVSVDVLRERLADPVRWPFAPDGRAGIERWLAEGRDRT